MFIMAVLSTLVNSFPTLILQRVKLSISDVPSE